MDGEKAIKQAIENSNTRFYKAFENFSILRDINGFRYVLMYRASHKGA